MHACTLLPPILCLVAAAAAQGTAADYQRAERLGNLYRGKLDAGPREVQWAEDSRALWFTQQSDGAAEFVRIDVASGERTTATSAAAREALPAPFAPFAPIGMGKALPSRRSSWLRSRKELAGAMVSRAMPLRNLPKHVGQTTNQTSMH